MTTTPHDPLNSSELDNLRQIWEYYHQNRQVGHTTAMIDGANKTPCILIVADNQQRKYLMRSVQPHVKMVTVTEAKMGKLKGTKMPLLIEHYALTGMFDELLSLMAKHTQEAYKKGYIAGGVHEIVRHDKAYKEVVKELKRDK